MQQENADEKGRGAAVHQPSTPAATLYQRALGEEFAGLHPTLRSFHSATSGATAEGRFRVVRGRGIRHFLGALLGFPPAGDSLRVLLKTDARGKQERWERFFERHPMHSTLSFQHGLLWERAGPVSVGFRLTVCGQRLLFDSERVRFLGVPLPALLAPKIHVVTAANEDGGWRIEMTLSLRGGGLLLSYHGHMKQRPPDEPQQAFP